MFFNRISKLIQYTLTVTQPANGSITVNGKTGTSFVFDEGDKVTIKKAPFPTKMLRLTPRNPYSLVKEKLL